jgi:thiol-disulfide isomerase/thioredoxin
VAYVVPEPDTDGSTPPSARQLPTWVPRWLTLSNLFTVAVLVWAAPRCWPHVEALVGARMREARMPAYTVTTRDGRTITADSLRGRVVFVNVWATWCPPCRAEMPALQQLADAYAAEGLVMLGLSVDRGPANTVDAFLAERAITYPVAIVGSDVIDAFGGVRGYPTSFLVDKAGVVRHAVMGPVGPVTLRPAIRRLLAEPSPTAQ